MPARKSNLEERTMVKVPISLHNRIKKRAKEKGMYMMDYLEMIVPKEAEA
jgi:predicted DNA binding CopG/RHH family protein